MSEHTRARADIRDVIMPARGMVDGIAALGSGPALERAQLREQARMIREFNEAPVDQREELAIQLAAGQLARNVADAEALQRGADPPERVAITGHRRTAVLGEDRGLRSCDGEGIEGRLVPPRHSILLTQFNPGPQPGPSPPVGDVAHAFPWP